jgi:peptidoglycan/LPS O-acetylase OafA/YrhL
MTGTNNLRTRNQSIDGLRGLLAAYVMFWHYAQVSNHLHIWLPDARIAVMAFFMMSAYVLTPSWDGNFPIFLARRFLRLWPVFALCLVVGSTLSGVALRWTYFVWYPLVESSTSFPIDLPMWSLFVEAWAMLAMPLIVWGGKTLPRTVATCLLFAGVAHLLPMAANGALFVIGSYCTKFDFDFAILRSSIPQWLGKVSYSLYLTHYIVFGVCAYHMPSIAIYVQLPIALLVGYIVWLMVERHSITFSRWAAKQLYDVEGRVQFRSALRSAR